MKKKNEFSLGEALEKYLQNNGLKEKSLTQKVISDWERIMGKPIAMVTQKIWYKSGIFYIKLDNPTWKNELMMSREKIRAMLNSEMGAIIIKEIRIF